MIPTSHARRGSVLIMAMALLIVLVSLTLLLAKSMRAEAMSSSYAAAQLQADAIARGAAEYVRNEVDGSAGTLPRDSELLTEAVPLGPGYFWIIKHDPDNESDVSFGLTDEAGKLNLNAASADALSRLPWMTTEIAAAIVDWRDSDETLTPGGAESSYYLSLNPARQAKNSPFETVDELRLVKDVEQELLYDNDSDRNGLMDIAPVVDAQSSGSRLGQGGTFDHGLAAYVTVYGNEPSTDSSGQARVNVNAGGPQLASVLGTVVSGAQLTDVLNRARDGRPFSNLLDFYYRTGLTLDQFRSIMDRLTVGQSRRGVVNINSASRKVLLCLPTMTDSDVEAIIGRRGADGDIEDLAVLTEILSRDKAIAIGGLVTTQSYYCSADILAVDSAGRAFKRYRTVIDARSSPPNVVFWEDLTTLGWPLSEQILTDLRAGKAPTPGMGAGNMGAGMTMARSPLIGKGG